MGRTQNHIRKEKKFLLILKEQKGITLNKQQENVKSNFAYFPILFENASQRDKVYSVLRENGIYARKYFYPLTADAACFKNKYKGASLEKARYFTERILTLPLYADLETESVIRIVEIIKRQG